MSFNDGFAEVAFNSEVFRKRRKAITEKVLRAGYKAVSETTRELELAIEAATAQAGLGKLAKAWKSKIFPKPGKLANEPVGIVYTGAGARTHGALSAYTRGATIKGKRGQFLAIALPAAGPRYYGRAKVSITPAEWERRTNSKLRFVYRKRKNPLLVLDEGVLSKKKQVARLNTARRRASGRANLTIPVFVLVPIVKVRARLSIAAIKAPYAGRLAANFKSKLAGLAGEG